VCVRLRGQGGDEFYLLTWSDLQKIAIAHHGRYREEHGGVRPRTYHSLRMAIRHEMLNGHRAKWDVLDKQLPTLR
jgi:hypothetical protein